jgi:hypothetical protein
VVFEFASKETWQEDLEQKPLRYAQMGIKEYFAYDPNLPPIMRTTSRRLWGWHLFRRKMREIPPRPDGSLWSHYLESLLVPDGVYLRLYDGHGQLRPTQAESEAQRAEKLRSMGVDPNQI